VGLVSRSASHFSYAEEDSDRNFSDFTVYFRVIPNRGTYPRFFLNMDANDMKPTKKENELFTTG
jgi:hypothetical protein